MSPRLCGRPHRCHLSPASGLGRGRLRPRLYSFELRKVSKLRKTHLILWRPLPGRCVLRCGSRCRGRRCRGRRCQWTILHRPEGPGCRGRGLRGWGGRERRLCSLLYKLLVRWRRGRRGCSGCTRRSPFGCRSRLRDVPANLLQPRANLVYFGPLHGVLRQHVTQQSSQRGRPSGGYLEGAVEDLGDAWWAAPSVGPHGSGMECCPTPLPLRCAGAT